MPGIGYEYDTFWLFGLKKDSFLIFHEQIQGLSSLLAPSAHSRQNRARMEDPTALANGCRDDGI